MIIVLVNELMRRQAANCSPKQSTRMCVESLIFALGALRLIGEVLAPLFPAAFGPLSACKDSRARYSHMARSLETELGSESQNESGRLESEFIYALMRASMVPS